MIEVRGLTKFYRTIMGVDNISFSIGKGDIVGFLGPNGAGKTTTMRMLTCFIPPTSGTATIAGFDILKDPMEVKKRIGYLPETPPLYRDMTVESYLRYTGSLRGLVNKKLEDGIEYVVSKCGLKDVRRRLIGNLSKGFRQRVGLAQALIHDPEVLILDEPTVGLDPKQITDIRMLIKELAGERTVILSTHILPEVTMTCNKVIIINKGKIIATDSYEDISKHLRKSEKIELLLSSPPQDAEKELEKIEGVVLVSRLTSEEGRFLIEVAPESDIRENLVIACVNKGYGLKEIKKVSLSLEDVFLGLVTDEKEI
ncbi:MAG: ATP-binding cassette domain-containing protein [Candidatus Schekmanbacteria bacterium]|nr:ATP-binding cassette domain-containing protein [Candidatus Schekmanbacteria bacterium]